MLCDCKTSDRRDHDHHSRSDCCDRRAFDSPDISAARIGFRHWTTPRWLRAPTAGRGACDREGPSLHRMRLCTSIRRLVARHIQETTVCRTTGSSGGCPREGRDRREQLGGGQMIHVPLGRRDARVAQELAHGQSETVDGDLCVKSRRPARATYNTRHHPRRGFARRVRLLAA